MPPHSIAIHVHKAESWKLEKDPKQYEAVWYGDFELAACESTLQYVHNR